jgi:hypothetical protein
MTDLVEFRFNPEDREALAAVYRMAADDPQFQQDNAAVLRDFALIDNEVVDASSDPGD